MRLKSFYTFLHYLLNKQLHYLTEIENVELATQISEKPLNVDMVETLKSVD